MEKVTHPSEIKPDEVCKRACVKVCPTQVRYAGDHALAADEVPQTLVVVLFGHQVVEPIKRCLVLPTQELQSKEGKNNEEKSGKMVWLSSSL